MISHISIELINGQSISISEPTAQELDNLNYWLNSDNKFYSLQLKNNITKINKDHVVRIRIFEK